MGLTQICIDTLISTFSKKFAINIKRTVRLAYKDISRIVPRPVNTIMISVGHRIPTSLYDVGTRTLEIFLPLLYLKPFGDYKLRNMSVRATLAHEMIEPLQNTPSPFKQFANKIFGSYSPPIASLGLELSDESLELFSRDICRDTRTDKPMTEIRHLAHGLPIAYRYLCADNEKLIQKLEIAQNGGKFKSNIPPLEVVCLILSVCRRWAICKQIEEHYKSARIYTERHRAQYQRLLRKLQQQRLQKIVNAMVHELCKDVPREGKLYKMTIAIKELIE